jgi:calcineurin-like phosphoesterase
MTGPRESVIGVAVEDALAAFVTQMPPRFGTAEGDVWIDSVLIDVGDDGLATGIEQLLVPARG